MTLLHVNVQGEKVALAALRQSAADPDADHAALLTRVIDAYEHILNMTSIETLAQLRSLDSAASGQPRVGYLYHEDLQELDDNLS